MKRNLALGAVMTIVLGGPLLGVTVVSSTAPTEADLDRALSRFDGEHRGRRKDEGFARVMASLEADLPEFSGSTEDPRWRAIRAFASRLAGKTPLSSRKKAGKTVRGGAEFTGRLFPEPSVVTYRFGHRDLVALDPKRDRDFDRSLRKGTGVDTGSLPIDARLGAMLHGCLPEYEVALCAIQMQLDVQPFFDDYGQFLVDWRNGGPRGDESFYEALDRTAGTSDAVFFYDAMLGDFVGRFAGKDGKRWSLNERHDRLCDAFLSYRQYRGFVEAVAYAVVLPSSAPFPSRLARYDYASVPVGAYSLRHQIDILAASHGFDYEVVVAECERFLRELGPPGALWNDYLVQGEFNAFFQADLPRMYAAIGSTNEAADRVRTLTADLAARLQQACLVAIAPD